MKTRTTILAAIAAILGIGALLLGPNALAEPSGKCAGGPGNAVKAYTTGDQGVAVCTTTGVKGSSEVRSKGSGNGYVVVDGDSSNQSHPSNCLDGYVGIQNGPSYKGPVSSSNGDYSYGAQPAPAPPSVPLCT